MRKLIIMITIALLVAGCGGAPAAAPAPTSPPAPTAAPTVTAQPLALPTAALGPTQAATPASGAANVESLARAALATHLNVAADTLTLVSNQGIEWPDGSLGCPDLNQGYTQAIVPGYLLLFSDGTKSYPIHTSESGAPLILCTDQGPEALK